MLFVSTPPGGEKATAGPQQESFHGESECLCNKRIDQYITASQRSKSHIIRVHTCLYSPNYSWSQSTSMPWACIRRKKHFGNFRTLDWSSKHEGNPGPWKNLTIVSLSDRIPQHCPGQHPRAFHQMQTQHRHWRSLTKALRLQHRNTHKAWFCLGVLDNG